ncbi:hypothetical protein AX774_g652 [Zancudomyces culisetae]|uniref:Uncharacterized protein n=1 Tax=Zancudomyces culisetae TaxID=1213189 RepID=A0A1R1PXX5_ZANCU|nr:hypothetical protein AX774_g652 [Zancudomyces culisetae]|eukprot:OMH85778.1 hypothetical protein AX774_g652 [Zancudomyces culisetae]
MVVLEKYAMENEKNMKKYKALIQEEENLMKMLEESERQLDIEQPQVAEELKAFSELEGKIKLLQQKQHKLVEELDPLREDQETIEERLVPIRSKANENHSQIAELKSQIVYSPEKVKMGKIELKKSLENVKQLISTKSELLKQFESGNSRLEELEVDQDHFYKMVLENLEIRDRRKELELEVSSHNEIITQATSELNIMKNKEDNLKFFLAACIEKIDRLEAQKINKVELLKEKVNSKHEDKMKIESMIEEILKKYEVGMKDVEKDKTDFEALKIRFQNEVNEANMLYTDMKNRLSLYQNAIGMSIAKCLSQYHK